MSCYHPMIYISTADMSDPEIRKIVEVVKLRHKGEDRVNAEGYLVPRELLVREGQEMRLSKALPIPCGRCIGCRLDYSRQWAERCVHEAEGHEYNYFLTLTYDDDHLPIGSKGVPTLIKDEVSKFMKRFRESMRLKYGYTDIRFFACGEYGDTSLRPHYHIILFNCPIPDLQERHPIKVDGKIKNIKQYDSNGELLLYSPLVAEAWQHRGTAQIGQVSYESCAYVARYVVKKLYGKEGKQYDDCGIIPPFVRMSRDPGIGYDWYMTNMDHIYEFDSITFKRGDTVVNQKPGKYCDKLLRKVDEDKYFNLKKKRHADFYDSVDCKTFDAVDVVINNMNAEILKERSAKLLKRNV